MKLPARDLAAEVAKHFQGTPAERMELARRAGEEALQLFLAASPPTMTRDQGLEILRRNKAHGRRPSRLRD